MIFPRPLAIALSCSFLASGLAPGLAGAQAPPAQKGAPPAAKAPAAAAGKAPAAKAKAREESRREIAAYVAEGTISPDDAVRLINAGEEVGENAKRAKA